MKKITMLFSLIWMLLAYSCVDEEQQVTKEFPKDGFIELVKDTNAIYLGHLTPFDISVKNNIASVAFIQTPIRYDFPVVDETSLHCVDVLKEAVVNRFTIGVFSREDRPEIVQINFLDEEFAHTYQNVEKKEDSSRQYGLRDPMPIEFYLAWADHYGVKVPTERDVLFGLGFGNSNWGYIADGCYARAHDMYRVYHEAGYLIMKIFVFDPTGTSLKGYSREYDCYVHWAWHVANFLVYEKGEGEYGMGVLDPTITTLILPYQQWLRELSLEDYCPVFITYGDVYLYDPQGYGWYDDGYVHTDCVLKAYKNAKGCEKIEHGCQAQLRLEYIN